MSEISVLFVCMGNICRSPTAHGVFEQLVINASLQDKIFIDSAGTHSYHMGEKPDSRSAALAKESGYNLGHIRSRCVESEDFDKFDFIIAMDSDNLSHLRRQCPEQYLHKLHLFLEFAEIAVEKGHVDVPDPYYGGAKGFSYVLALVEEGAKNILQHIKTRHL